MKKIVTLLTIGCLVLTGCGNSMTDDTELLEQDEYEFSLPYEISIKGGTIELSDIYIQQENTEYGYEGWIVFVLDFSGMSEKDRYWFEEDYDFDLKDESDLIDKSYLHLDNKYESKIQDDGKKYVFASIEESQNPLEELQMYFELNVTSVGNGSSYNEIKGEVKDFGVVDTLPDEIETAINEVLTGYLQMFYDIYS